MNCQGEPIIFPKEAETETFIIDRFAIPTLHCILGPVKKICHVLEEKWPEFVAWCKSINLVRDPYNNKDYNGNNCNKLLNKLEELKKVIPEDFLIFAETLEALKNVKISCFGAEAGRPIQTIKKRSRNLK